jgi:hypothetical protein
MCQFPMILSPNPLCISYLHVFTIRATWAHSNLLNFNILRIPLNFFFSVPVCAITASGVADGTFVSMNRFSTLCGWLAQRQGWRVKGEYDRVSERDLLELAPDLSTRDLWINRRWARGEMRILSTHPCGTSRVLLHAVKSYYMGPSRFTSHPRGRWAADFYRS